MQIFVVEAAGVLLASYTLGAVVGYAAKWVVRLIKTQSPDVSACVDTRPPVEPVEHAQVTVQPIAAVAVKPVGVAVEERSEQAIHEKMLALTPKTSNILLAPWQDEGVENDSIETTAPAPAKPCENTGHVPALVRTNLERQQRETKISCDEKRSLTELYGGDTEQAGESVTALRGSIASAVATAQVGGGFRMDEIDRSALKPQPQADKHDVQVFEAVAEPSARSSNVTSQKDDATVHSKTQQCGRVLPRDDAFLRSAAVAKTLIGKTAYLKVAGDLGVSAPLRSRPSASPAPDMQRRKSKRVTKPKISKTLPKSRNLNRIQAGSGARSSLKSGGSRRPYYVLQYARPGRPSGCDMFVG